MNKYKIKWKYIMNKRTMNKTKRSKRRTMKRRTRKGGCGCNNGNKKPNKK